MHGEVSKDLPEYEFCSMKVIPFWKNCKVQGYKSTRLCTCSMKLIFILLGLSLRKLPWNERMKTYKIYFRRNIRIRNNKKWKFIVWTTQYILLSKGFSTSSLYWPLLIRISSVNVNAFWIYKIDSLSLKRGLNYYSYLLFIPWKRDWESKTVNIKHKTMTMQCRPRISF